MATDRRSHIRPDTNPPMLKLISTHTQLEDLYVTPQCRGIGVGKALFAELGRIAEEKVWVLHLLFFYFQS
jgi:GNAT superfamily N-acetyltransferase